MRTLLSVLFACLLSFLLAAREATKMRNILLTVIFCVISFTTLLAQDSIVAKFVARSHNIRSWFFLSTNNGASWLAVYNGLPENCSVLTCVVNGTYLFAGTDGCGVFLSTDNGTSWTEVNTGLTNTFVYSLAVSDTNLFAGTNGGVFLSTNNGTSWTEVNTGLTNTDVRSFAVSGTDLFAGTYGGVTGTLGSVFLSTDNGTNWTDVNIGLTGTDVLSLAVSGKNLFAWTAGFGGGVFLSTNSGTSWTATGLRNTYVYALTVSGTNLFAGTDKGVTLPYRLFIPDNYSPSQKYPLVLALHGSGEGGTNNTSQMKGRMATSWADPVNQSNYPCFVVVPQCPTNEYWGNGPIAG